MTYPIYKAGVPAVVSVATKGSIGTPGPVAKVGNYVATTVSSVAGVAVKHGQNSNNGLTVSIAKSRNTPQS